MPTGAVTGVWGVMSYSILISVVSIVLLAALGYAIYKLKVIRYYF